MYISRRNEIGLITKHILVEKHSISCRKSREMSFFFKYYVLDAINAELNFISFNPEWSSITSVQDHIINKIILNFLESITSLTSFTE